MKKFVLIAALAAISACADDDAAEPDAATTEAAAPAPTETVAAESWAGTYEFEVDGVATVAVLNPDGTYTDTQDGEVVESGTWLEGNGQVCFDSEGDDTPEQCWTSTEPDEAGVFTATADDGTTLTITRTE